MEFRFCTGAHSSHSPSPAPGCQRSVTSIHSAHTSQPGHPAFEPPPDSGLPHEAGRPLHCALPQTVRSPGIYAGAVTHARTRPRPHRLRYRVFCLLLDLDAPEAPRLRLFGRNRRALVSFHDRDHGEGGDDLALWVRTRLAEAGVSAAPGEKLRIEALCYPRIFGYVFNPLTVFFCWRLNGDLAAMLYEVSNTMGEKHTYVIPAGPDDLDPTSGRIRQRCPKKFYVSPFIGMDCTYNFRLDPPGERVRIGISEEDNEGVLLTALFSGQRRPLTDRALAWALLVHPLMTLKITLGIYWEAVRLLLKRTPVYSHTPAAHTIGYTIVAHTPDRS